MFIIQSSNACEIVLSRKGVHDELLTWIFNFFFKGFMCQIGLYFIQNVLKSFLLFPDSYLGLRESRVSSWDRTLLPYQG